MLVAHLCMCTYVQTHISVIYEYMCMCTHTHIYIFNSSMYVFMHIPAYRIHETFVLEARAIDDFSMGTQGRETSSTSSAVRGRAPGV